MTFDYISTRVEAKAMLAEFGSALTVGGTKTIGVIVSAVEAAMGDPTRGGYTVVPQTDKVCIIPGDIKRVPMVGDTVVQLKAEWKVIGVDEVAPAGIPVIYKLKVTR
jgi:hypothetical protein